MKSRMLVFSSVAVAALALASTILAQDEQPTRRGRGDRSERTERGGGGASRDTSPEARSRVFLMSVERDDTRRLSGMLKNEPQVISAKNEEGMTGLHLAKSKEMADLLIAAGADVNARANDGSTPLHAAAQHGRTDVVALLLDHGAELNATDNDGRTTLDIADDAKQAETVAALREKGAKSPRAIFEAISSGDIEAVKAVLAEQPGSKSARNVEKRTPLIAAVIKGSEPIVELLLQSKADPNAVDNYEKTALVLAADRPNVSIVKLLLAAGAEVNKPDGNGDTALGWATSNGELEIATALLGAGADVNAHSKNGSMPLLGPVINKHPEIVAWLLDHGASPDVLTTDGDTPVNVAVQNGDMEMLKLLLAHGSNPDTKNVEGRTALDIAVEQRSFEIADLLRAKGATGGPGSSEIFQAIDQEDLERLKRLIAAKADVNIVRPDGETPLIQATDTTPEFVAALIAAGADVKAAASSDGNTALHAAVDGGKSEIVTVLLANRADVNARNSAGKTALHLAVDQHDEPLVRLLLEHGADVEAHDTVNNATPLFYAAMDDKIPIAEALLAAHADINVRVARNLTPLHIAASRGNSAVAEWLVAHGADLEAMADDGGRPFEYVHVDKSPELAKALEPVSYTLMFAASHGHLEVVKECLAKDPTAVNYKSPNGVTALHAAARKVQPAIIEALLAAHADVNAVNKSGETPLLLAAAVAKDIASVKLLVDAGADLSVKNKDGATALDAAVFTGAWDAADLLRSKNAPGRISSGEIYQAARMNDAARVKKLLSGNRKLAKLTDEVGQTPLMFCVASTGPESAKLLLDAGTDINAADANGLTALHLAARYGSQAMALFLVEKKANLNARAKDGATPLDYASPADGKTVDIEKGADYAAIGLLLEAKGGKKGEELGPMKP